MRKTVLTFGLIAGALLSVMMLATLPFMDQIGFEHGEVIGYTSIVASLLLVFFGVRSYREHQGGLLSFGRAFAVGVLINVVASICYSLTWQVVYHKLMPDFGEKYAAFVLEKERASGASEQAIATKQAQIQKYQKLLENPILNFAMAFLEPFWVGVIVALVSAGILRTRRGRAPAVQTLAA